MRIGLLPATAPESEREKARDLGARFSGNTGNMIFDDSLAAMLPAAEVVRTHSHYDLAEYSHLVISLANLVSDVPPEPALRALRRRLGAARRTNPDLTIVVAAFGSQYDTMRGRPRIDADRLEFLRELSSWAPFVGVRGHFTEEVLNDHGIMNTWVVGDPALIHPSIAARREGAPAVGDVIVGWTPTGKYRDQLVRFLKWGADRNALYVGQSKTEAVRRRPQFSTLTGGRDLVKLLRYYSWNSDQTVDGLVEWMHRRGVAFASPLEWYEALRGGRVSVGTRYHGNAAAVIAGVPALQLLIDSRTQEMAAFHALPAVGLDSFDDHWSIEDVVKLADMGPFHHRLGFTRRNFSTFLQVCGVLDAEADPHRASLSREGLRTRQPVDRQRDLLPGDAARVATVRDFLAEWAGEQPTDEALLQLIANLHPLRDENFATLIEFGPALNYGLRLAHSADLVEQIAPALGRPDWAREGTANG